MSLSKESMPGGVSSPTTTTLGGDGSSAASCFAIAAWSNPRNVDGTTATLALVRSRM